MKISPVIEKNVPIPRGRQSGWKTLAASMEVGDSVFFESINAANSLTGAFRAMGMSASHRIVEGGFRVWRLS